MSIDLALLLCKARYTEVHLYTFCKQVVLTVLEKGYKNLREQNSQQNDFAVQANASSDAQVAQILSSNSTMDIGTKLQPEDFQAIENTAPEFKASLAKHISKFRGATNFSFDPAMLQNVPFVLGDLQLNSLDGQSVKTVRLLRMGCPTIEEGITEAYINPEFRAYMQTVACEGKKHLYISFQNENKKIWICNESGRNQAIKNLQNDFPKNLEVVILNQDSPFYKQKGPIFGVESLAKDAFKAQFFNQILSEEAGFYFPATWKQDAKFVERLHNLFDITAAILNIAEETVNIEERKDFIEVYYALLFLFALRYSNADVANGTCKDAIDRAMKTFSLVMHIILTCQKQEDNPECQQMHRVFTHAPALMTKKRPIIHARKERLITSFAKLDSEESKKMIKDFAFIIGIDPTSRFQVIAKENQTFELEG